MIFVDSTYFFTRDFLTPYDGNVLWIRMVLAFVVGSCVGSFLNVVALRSLAEQSWIIPRSYCMKCKHPLGFMDMIPIISYFLLNGKCRHCQEKYSWQYPTVEFATGLLFAIVLFRFGYTGDGVAMCIFAATLVTVTVTDFREHLIPHEITYPSILLGLLYYAVRHGSPADALIGAGMSYIVFDFIDFYGQVWIGQYKDDDEAEPSMGATPFVVDHSMDLKEKEYNPDDDIVMGGGDAVLSAVISCWIGWQQTCMAVMIAFLVGSFMGAIYLLSDMKKRDVLKHATIPAIKGFLVGFLLLSLPLVGMGYVTQNLEMFLTPQVVVLASLGGFAGGLFGAVMSGTKRFTNRFPFGPALAIGGLIAMMVSGQSWYWIQSGGINIQGGGL